MATYPKPTNIQPLSIFNSYYYDDSEDGVSVSYLNQNYLKFPQAQGNENLLGVTVSGRADFNSDVSFNGFTQVVGKSRFDNDVSFNAITQHIGKSRFDNDVSFNAVATLTTNPLANDNSQRLATTSWTQSLVSSIPTTPTLYPQKWLSSLNKTTASVATYSSQDLDIILPLPSNATTTGTNSWYIYVRVLCQTSIYGVYNTTIIGNLFSCSSELIIQMNIRFLASTRVTAQASSVSNSAGSTSLGNMVTNSTNIPVYNSATATNTTVNFTPITVTSFPNGLTNILRLTWNQFSATTGIQQSVLGMTRSAEILSCSLNAFTNAGNFDTWNVITYPNANTTASQNVPAYFAPVSTNNY